MSENVDEKKGDLLKEIGSEAKSYLKEHQYKATNYLDSRIAIHKYNINSQSFFEWAWEKLAISETVKILEVGCGPGTFWVDNMSDLTDQSSVLMTDFSQAMLDKASQKIGSDKRFTYEIADIDNLQFDDGEYDLVMAHFVMYHSSNKDAALKGLRRVCNSSGKVSITTNSEEHMKKVYDIGKSVDSNFPTDRNISSFTEEIADNVLPEYFSSIDKHISRDYIRVNQRQLILDYVRSAVEPREIKVSDDFYELYGEIVDKEISENGYFEITKRSPIYICKP